MKPAVRIAVLVLLALLVPGRHVRADLCEDCLLLQELYDAYYANLQAQQAQLASLEAELVDVQLQIVAILQLPPDKWDENVVYQLNQLQQQALDLHDEIESLQDYILVIQGFVDVIAAQMEACSVCHP